MKQITLSNFKNQFEAEIICELLKQNAISSTVQNTNDEYLVLVSKIDFLKAQEILKSYNKEETAVKKGSNNKANILRIALLILGAVAFYYIMSLMFKLILQLY